MRPALEVADVFRRHGAAFRQQHRLHLGRVGRHLGRRSGAIRRDDRAPARLRTEVVPPMASSANKVRYRQPIFGYAERDPVANICQTFSPAVSAEPKAAPAIRCHSAVATTPIALPARGSVEQGFNEVAPGVWPSEVVPESGTAAYAWFALCGGRTR